MDDERQLVRRILEKFHQRLHEVGEGKAGDIEDMTLLVAKPLRESLRKQLRAVLVFYRGNKALDERLREDKPGTA